MDWPTAVVLVSMIAATVTLIVTGHGMWVLVPVAVIAFLLFT
jgi:hypothetical protein